MKRIALGTTGLQVPEICVGTMTWGSQNTEAEGHAQMDMALDHGVTFWDTAEMYPVNPVRAETAGRTEEIVGSWLAARGGRDRIVVATKVAGKGPILRPMQKNTPASRAGSTLPSSGSGKYSDNHSKKLFRNLKTPWSSREAVVRSATSNRSGWAFSIATPMPA